MRIRDFFRDEISQPGLDSALRAWKNRQSGAGTPGLSEQARQRVLRAIAQPARETRSTPWAPLFVPASRLLAAGAAPALLLAGLIGYGVQADRKLDRMPEIARLEVSKAGGEIVFEIQNGDRTHRIYRMEPANGTSTWELVDTTRGVFRDRLRDDSGLVIYRID